MKGKAYAEIVDVETVLTCPEYSHPMAKALFFSEVEGVADGDVPNHGYIGRVYSLPDSEVRLNKYFEKHQKAKQETDELVQKFNERVL